MKEINLKKSVYDYEEMAELSQNREQYDNFSVRLCKIGKAVVYTEDDCTNTRDFVLGKDEKESALEDPDGYLDDCAGEWANNSDESTAVERIAWGLDNVDDLVVDDYCSDVEVIKIENYVGYSPIDSLGYFDNFVDAKNAIKEDDPDGTYYLQHGEMGRPAYYIIKA